MLEQVSVREFLAIVFVLLGGAALAVENALTGRSLLIALSLTAFVTLIGFAVVHFNLQALAKPIRSDLGDAVKALDTLVRFIQEGHRDIAGILKDDKLGDREKRAVGEVWIITRDLAYDTDKFLPIVRANVGRGVGYRYLLPDGPELAQRFRDLRRDLAGAAATPGAGLVSVEARAVPGFFPFLAEHGVFSPGNLELRTGFTVFPEQRAEYNILLSRERTDQLCLIFQEWWNRSPEIK